MARAQIRKHSKFYIALVESVLCQFSPSIEARPFLQPVKNAITLRKSRTGVDLAHGVELLRRTANVRKQRAFLALVDHPHFQDLSSSSRVQVWEQLRTKLTEMFAAECDERLEQGWQKHFKELSEMVFERALLRREGLASEGGTLHEAALRLLQRLHASKNKSSKSHLTLCSALQKWIDEHPENWAISRDHTIQDPMEELDNELAHKVGHT